MSLQTGNRVTESLATVCTVSELQAGGPHNLTEPAFLENCPSPGPFFLDSSSAHSSTPGDLVLDR